MDEKLANNKSNEAHLEEPQNGPKNKFNRHRKPNEKFVPNFKKKLPTWKQIDSELKELLPKYDEVKSVFT